MAFCGRASTRNLSNFYGDLLVPDLDPFEAVEHYTASETRSALAKLDDIAQSLGLATIWSQAQLVGSDYEPGVPGPAAGQPGVSLAWACVPGIGFWRDHSLHSILPEYLQNLVTDSDEQRRVFVSVLTEPQALNSLIQPHPVLSPKRGCPLTPLDRPQKD